MTLRIERRKMCPVCPGVPRRSSTRVLRQPDVIKLNEHRMKAGGFVLRLKVAGLRLKPPEVGPG